MKEYIKKARDVFVFWIAEKWNWFHFGRYAYIADDFLITNTVLLFCCFKLFLMPVNITSPSDWLWTTLPLVEVIFAIEIAAYDGGLTTSSFLYHQRMVVFGENASQSARRFFKLILIFILIHSQATAVFFFYDMLPVSHFVGIMLINFCSLILHYTMRLTYSMFWYLSTEKDLKKAAKIMEIIRKYDKETPFTENKAILIRAARCAFLVIYNLTVFVLMRVLIVNLYTTVDYENKSSASTELLWSCIAMSFVVFGFEFVKDVGDKMTNTERIYCKKRFVAFGSKSTRMAKTFLAINIFYNVFLSIIIVLYWLIGALQTFNLFCMLTSTSIMVMAHFSLRYCCSRAYNLTTEKELELIKKKEAKRNRRDDDKPFVIEFVFAQEAQVKDPEFMETFLKEGKDEKGKKSWNIVVKDEMVKNGELKKLLEKLLP